MKRLLAILLLITFLVIFTSCSDSLPKGKATEICINEGNTTWSMHECEYEYINESTVKIIYARSTYYVPTSSIVYIKIWDQDMYGN